MALGIIENLTDQLMRLPGIGRKTAQRLAFFILAMPANDAKAISEAIDNVKDNARFCSQCFNISDSELCSICSDPSRDASKICVVEEPSNIMVFERSGAFRGHYHVLLGALSPIDGITPEKLKVGELVARVKKGGIEEVILATNPNTKGEMTAQYVRETLEPLEVSISRIAYGLPMGGDIEFADEVTLMKSLEGRRKL
ncbi:MAG TPA: recombination protein RecR [Nitrospirae bacterium]|nr:recombination protein RecR [Nitrospirota bacterium]